jgi:hypothetical protein
MDMKQAKDHFTVHEQQPDRLHLEVRYRRRKTCVYREEHNGDIKLNGSDYQNYGSSGPGEPDEFNRFKATVAKRNMATASLVCGIIAILSFQLFFISLPLAGASIILALLSRQGRKVEGRARIALIAGAAAVIFSCLYTWYAIRTVYRDPRLRAQMEQLYNYYTGQISGTRESEGTAQSENPQEILSDILSGKYRENKEKEDSLAVPENGGAFI